jgi:predicted nucleic acid-binding protein
MMYLLDTNVVSELRRTRPHGAFVAWLHSMADTDLHLSAVTIGELQAGIRVDARAGRGQVRRDRSLARSRRRDLQCSRHGRRVLAMDAATFRRWACLMQHRSDHLIEDAMIAATAPEHDLVVVTRNVGDFVPFGVRTLNPFA